MRLWAFDIRKGHAGAHWLHATNPSDWVCFPHTGVATREGILVKQTAPEEPLLKSVLGKPHNLVLEDLVQLAEHFGLHTDGSRGALLGALAASVSGGDAAFVELAVGEKHAAAAALLVEDPLFEAAYADLEPENQK